MIVLFSVRFLNTVLGSLSRLSLRENVEDRLSSHLPPWMFNLTQMVGGNAGDTHTS